MVQRKVPNKLGIKPHYLKSDTKLVNIGPSSPHTHDNLKKIMKKSRPIKRSDESRSLPPFKKKKTQILHNNEPRSTPNYMRSTSSFEARKERSPKTPSPTKSSKTNGGLDSGHKGSRTSSLKMVRTLAKTPSFKRLRPFKKVILCEDLDAQRATCSSTLKKSKFPDYLQLSPGGTELEGTSAMKICPYTYCSLNGHHHAPLPPLKYFLSAKRRAMKTQKSFKLGCLSPRQTKPVVKKNDIREPVIIAEEAPKVDMKMTDAMKEESRDFFVEINGCSDLECSDIDWEEGYCSEKSKDEGGDVCEEKIQKMGDERLYGELEEVYDEESVSSGAWSEEDGHSESESSYQWMKINHRIEDQDIINYDTYDASSTATEADVNDKMDELQGLDFPINNENIKCSINYQHEIFSQESKSVPEKSEDGNEKNQMTIIYNIIQFNISIFVSGEKTERSETNKGGVEEKMEAEEVSEAMEEQDMSDEYDDANNLDAFDGQEIVSNKQFNANYFNEKQEDYVQECNECEPCSESNSMDFEDNDVKEINEEPTSRSDEEQPHDKDEITSATDLKGDSFSKKSDFLEEQPDPSTNLRGSTRGQKPEQEMDDSREFNPRGPNFLPEVPDPDAETVDLKHQDVDERKNAEEWMVDFALQQAVTTLAPAQKRKVALLVEAFEKVMPIPKYVTPNTHSTKAFTNARPIQACS